MIQTRIITPKVVEGFVSRQTNLGVDSYDLRDLYSPDTELWKSTVLDLGSPKYPPQVATAPTRYWFDRSRYNNHGTIVGGVWKQLPSGVWVMSFDGDDYIDCGTPSALDITGDISVLAWVYPTELTAGTYYTVAAKSGGGYTDSQWDFGHVTGRLELAATNGTAVFTALKVGVSLNSWHFVVGVIASNVLDVYLNNVKGTAATLTGTKSTTTENTTIGVRRLSNPINYFKGTIGEVLILGGYAASAEFIRWYYLRTKWRYGL